MNSIKLLKIQTDGLFLYCIFIKCQLLCDWGYGPDKHRDQSNA